MDVDKILSRLTIGTAIVGLIIVLYALANYSIPASSTGYTELNFMEPVDTPSVMKVGEKYVIPFVVSSKEKEATSYNYTATFNEAEIARGKFVLAPNEKKSLTLELVPKSPSWKLSSNARQHWIDRFTVDEVFIKEGEDGSIALYPGQLNRSELAKKNLTVLPLDLVGIYSSESQYTEGPESLNIGWRGRMPSHMSINKAEIYMEHSSQTEGYKFTWSNRVQLPDLDADFSPIVWLAAPKIGYPGTKMRSGSIAYKNTALDFKTSLPGEIYLTPVAGEEGKYIISYNSKNAASNKTRHVEKNTIITIGKGTVSVENIIEEKAYIFDKAKLTIFLNSGTGKSYEIHILRHVKD